MVNIMWEISFDEIVYQWVATKSLTPLVELYRTVHCTNTPIAIYNAKSLTNAESASLLQSFHFQIRFRTYYGTFRIEIKDLIERISDPNNDFHWFKFQSTMKTKDLIKRISNPNNGSHWFESQSTLNSIFESFESH